jgi:hypothetical protein
MTTFGQVLGNLFLFTFILHLALASNDHWSYCIFIGNQAAGDLKCE